MKTPSKIRPLHLVLVLLAGLAMAVGGYFVGRDMAHRDNARDAAAR